VRNPGTKRSSWTPAAESLSRHSCAWLADGHELSSDNVQQQPPFGGDTFWGYPTQAEIILDVLSLISVPSRRSVQSMAYDSFLPIYFAILSCATVSSNPNPGRGFDFSSTALNDRGRWCLILLHDRPVRTGSLYIIGTLALSLTPYRNCVLRRLACYTVRSASETETRMERSAGNNPPSKPMRHAQRIASLTNWGVTASLNTT